MKTLLATIKSLGNVNVSMTNTKESCVISVKPSTNGIKDEAARIIKPFTITIDENDSEQEICVLIEEFVPKAVEKVSNIKAYEDSIDAAEKSKKENKEAEEKFEKAYKEILKMLDPKEPKDETKHTKKFNEFKENFSSNEKFKEVEKMFNDKYQSIDLFSKL